MSHFMTKPVSLTFRAIAAVSLLASLLVVATTSQRTNASGANPDGINIGLEFVWDNSNSPNGITASFINSDGNTLNNCGQGTADSNGCHFVFEYSVGSFSQPVIRDSGGYSTWRNPTEYETRDNGVVAPAPGSGGCNSSGPSNPLTLNDCFNANSFGQIFYSGGSGTLSSFKMSMTCLQPADKKIELFALLYELNDPAVSIKGTAPIATTKLNLSTCPTTTSWEGKTFAASDFAMIPFDFKNVTLTQGTPYGVYFAGSAVPGAPPVGADEAVASASGTTEDELQTELPEDLQLLTAVRLIDKGDKTKTLRSRTPATCAAVGDRVIALAEGECTVLIRSVQTSKRSKVLARLNTTITSNGTQVGLSVSGKNTIRFNRYSATPKRISATVVKQAKKAKAVVILGHTATFTGNGTSNTKLSLARARYIRRHLINQKVQPSLISVAGLAARQPVSDKKVEKDQRVNRRVEVYFLT